MTGKNIKNHYLKTQILTASREQLVLMLYDGAIRFCESARQAWGDGEIEDAHNALTRTQEIILELSFALDREKGGDIAESFATLYVYCYEKLVRANVEHSDEMVVEVLTILRNLREGWAQAMESMVEEGEQAEGTGAVAELSGTAPAAPVPSASAPPAPAPVTKPAPAHAAQALARIKPKKMAVPNPEVHSSISVQG